MPRAEGLFRRAIAQSGAAHQVISAATAQRVGRRLAEKLGVAATREAIAAVPVERLLHAQAALKAELLAHPDPERWGAEVVASMLPWQPVVDGDVLPARPIDRIAAGAGADVDVLVGTNTDEWRLFLVAAGVIDQITAGALAGSRWRPTGSRSTRRSAAYRAAHPGASAGDLLAAVQTDWWCRIPALRLADAHAKSPAATYMYEFAWRSPQFGGLLGACHALEIAFVFDTLGNGTWSRSGGRTRRSSSPTPCTPPGWRLPPAGDSGWPRYDLSRRATMRFDTTSAVVDDPRSAERALWAGVR